MITSPTQKENSIPWSETDIDVTKQKTKKKGVTSSVKPRSGKMTSCCMILLWSNEEINVNGWTWLSFQKKPARQFK